ncbi:Os08g0464950 [Oryza sativa Japonica Group]|uniref:Os08g0464950 protein n=1 Tax=Oryza sativa subsp. japonica TaxID=39947 RepID=A0A0P0XH82_ORYSJ|nr:hypothetical protein EE612_044764 [Oryza sativa]BAT05791.1 Os08g0464950 [Oryza sativa Japonica Group]
MTGLRLARSQHFAHSRIPAVHVTATDGLGNPKNSHKNQPKRPFSLAGGGRIYRQLLAGGGGRGWAAVSGKPRGAANSAAKDDGRCGSGDATAVLAAAVGAAAGDVAAAGAEVEAVAGLEATRSQEGHMERVVAGRCM